MHVSKVGASAGDQAQARPTRLVRVQYDSALGEKVGTLLNQTRVAQIQGTRSAAYTIKAGVCMG